jgi:xanthine dehydrogenase/oxidase
MSLYALVRNSYDPTSKVFKLSASDIELQGHLDGNLCRCTGYKPILQAAKTFITEDLNGRIALTPSAPDEETHLESLCLEKSFDIGNGVIGLGKTNGSCGRPGGCCRDIPKSEGTKAEDSRVSSVPRPKEDFDSTSQGRSNTPEASIGSLGHPNGATNGIPVKSYDAFPKNESITKKGFPQYNFAPYTPDTELIFPPALQKYKRAAVYYGNSTHIWLRPINIEQLLLIKDAYPSAKLVGGFTEVQVEVRFKNSSFPILVYVSDVEELRSIQLPKDESELLLVKELVIGANLPLTEVERVCGGLFAKLGQRASVLEAIRKQLRYFAGRQIRNVASLAGNIATASPISDINPVLMASGATLTIQSKAAGLSTLSMSDFFVSYRKTKLPDNAVITSINIPLPAEGFKEITKAYKQAKRKEDDIAIVTTSFRVRLDDNGMVSDSSLAYGGMAPMTVYAVQTMKSILGKKWHSSATLDAAMASISQEFDLKYSVPGGMAIYRKTLAISLFFRFWHEVVSDLKLGQVDPDLIGEIHRGISSGFRDNYNPNEMRVVGKQIPHLSALKQTTGEAEYIDDMPPVNREIFGALVLSSRARAKLVQVDYTPALGPGLALGYVDKHNLTAEQNIWGSIVKDEPFFAEGEVFSEGQPIGLVYAETELQAQAAARAVKIVYEDLPVIITIDEAIEAGSFFNYGKMLKKGAAIDGKMNDVWATCDKIFEGTIRISGQEHFYLECNAALVIPNNEDKTYEVWSSTQNTMETQEFVSQVTGVPSHRVNVRVKRMGGAFGGKESRSVPLACILAVAAKKEQRPVRCMLYRGVDMMTSGQRHPFLVSLFPFIIQIFLGGIWGGILEKLILFKGPFKMKTLLRFSHILSHPYKFFCLEC